MSEPSLQDRYAPEGRCFGCGPANPKGLRIKSFPDGEALVATWRAEPHHEAFTGMLNGGIVGTLLDCHGNWCAAWRLMRERELDAPPCTVTARYEVKLLRPTPSGSELELRARVVEVRGGRATVAMTLAAGGEVCATGEGTFVAVKPGHPAYHRW